MKELCYSEDGREVSIGDVVLWFETTQAYNESATKKWPMVGIVVALGPCNECYGLGNRTPDTVQVASVEVKPVPIDLDILDYRLRPSPSTRILFRTKQGGVTLPSFIAGIAETVAVFGNLKGVKVSKLTCLCGPGPVDSSAIDVMGVKDSKTK